MPQPLSASFRDPSGFVFELNGILYRWVSEKFRKNYDLFIASGLCETLHKEGLLIAHKEVSLPISEDETPYKILQPDKIPFISYPHEWCFSQLKDAALCTLDIAEKALHAGMVLKDATAYNVQFLNGSPVFIDTLSFEEYKEGTPWVAYRQFCQHFLAPLALMAKTDVSLNKLFTVHIDGIPLELASKLLPLSSKFNLGLALHIHAHARTQKKYSGKSVQKKDGKVSKNSLLALFDSLKSTVKKLSWRPEGTEWGEYYSSTNYSQEAMGEKARIVRELVREVSPKSVWDLGANTGVFSRIAMEEGAHVVSCDIDPAAVEKNYLDVREKKLNMLPLVMDLTNPSPNFGWGGTERASLTARGPVDCILALAVIHHLGISSNVPLRKVAEYFHEFTKSLVLEFVPKEDSQVRKLLRTREDIFPLYTEAGLQEEFSKWFIAEKKFQISGTKRSIYLFKKVNF